MIARRKILIALGAAALAPMFSALAQERRPRRIAYMTGNLGASAAWLPAFRQGMRELGWLEGRDYVIETGDAKRELQALAGLADKLLATRPDLFLTPGNESVSELLKRTRTIPIVCTLSVDPVGSGFAASLQRPGGNVTGLTNLATELGAKRLDLLKAAFPRITHVAVIAGSSANSLDQAKEIEIAARQLKLRATRLVVGDAADLDAAFRRAESGGVQAYITAGGFLVNALSKSIVDRATRARLPSIFAASALVEAGGLMSYGISAADNFRRAAAYVVKILKGAKAGDLPIEQPTKFELVVNMKTAKAMGFTIPHSVLLRADRVIE